MKVDEFLKQRNVEFDVIPHRETYDAQRMAQALHVPGREVAKTVLLKANGGFAERAHSTSASAQMCRMRA